MANLLGIDIGPTSVRGVLVKTQLRRVQLAQYIEVPIHPDVVEPAIVQPAPIAATPFGAPPVVNAPAAIDALGLPVVEGTPPSPLPPGEAGGGTPTIDQPSSVAPTPDGAPATPTTPLSRAVAELIRQAGGTNIDVLAAFPGDAVSLRRVELPKAAEKKLDELLPFEMESVLPFEVADTLLDHQLIDADPKQIRLLVSAAPKARIREELSRLSEAGADPVELVPAPAALAGLAQFIPALATEGPHVVVVLGTSSADVCVIKKGRAELARTLSIGTRDLWRAQPASPFAAPAQVNEAVAAQFVRELKQTFLSYRMQGGTDPETVSVAGDLMVPGLFEWLGTGLSRSVMPLAMPEVPGSVAASAAAAPSIDGTPPPPPATRDLAPFAAALGVVGHSLLRGKHLDFRKGEFVKKRDLSVFRDFGPILGIAGAAVAFAFFFSIWARWSVLDDRRQLLEDELARVSEQRLGEETRNPTRARALLETGRRSPDPMPAFTAFDALVAVSAAVPEGVTHDLSRLAIDLGDGRSEGHLEIQGTVSTVDDAERISRALSEVECFRELELGPATTTSDGRRNYRIEGDILCPGAAPAEEGRGRRRRSGSSSDSAGAEGGEG